MWGLTWGQFISTEGERPGGENIWGRGQSTPKGAGLGVAEQTGRRCPWLSLGLGVPVWVCMGKLKGLSPETQGAAPGKAGAAR